MVSEIFTVWPRPFATKVRISRSAQNPKALRMQMPWYCQVSVPSAMECENFAHADSSNLFATSRVLESHSLESALACSCFFLKAKNLERMKDFRSFPAQY